MVARCGWAGSAGMSTHGDRRTGIKVGLVIDVSAAWPWMAAIPASSSSESESDSKEKSLPWGLDTYEYLSLLDQIVQTFRARGVEKVELLDCSELTVGTRGHVDL